MGSDITLTEPDLTELSKQYDNVLEHLVKPAVDLLRDLTNQYKEKQLVPPLDFVGFGIHAPDKILTLFEVRRWFYSSEKDLITVWVKEIYEHPISGDLIKIDSEKSFPARWLNLNILKKEFGANIVNLSPEQIEINFINRELTELDKRVQVAHSDLKDCEEGIVTANSDLIKFDKKKKKLLRRLKKLNATT